MGLTESQRKAQQGVRLLQQHGWPDAAIKEVMDIFMQAGFSLCLEQLEAHNAAKEAMIQGVQTSFRGDCN